jgi:hypothetical protein
MIGSSRHHKRPGHKRQAFLWRCVLELPAAAQCRITSARRPAREEIDDCKQDEGAEERHEQRQHAEIASHDISAADQRIEPEAGDEGADNTDHNVALWLCVSAHHKAGEPADGVGKYKKNNQADLY